MSREDGVIATHSGEPYIGLGDDDSVTYEWDLDSASTDAHVVISFYPDGDIDLYVKMNGREIEGEWSQTGITNLRKSLREKYGENTTLTQEQSPLHGDMG